ncbi:MAG: peptidylprolyl isomerase [Pseudomonadota bacterium]
MTTKKLSAALALSLGLIVGNPVGWAQSEGSGEEDPVMATVNGDPIHRSDVLKAAEQLPAQYQSQIEDLMPVLLERVIDLELVRHAAEAAGYTENETVKERVEQAKKEIIQDVYLRDTIDQRISDEDIQAEYDAFLADNPPQPELHARHILLESEDDANAVIADLEGGADFAELAKERSTGPSGPNGGDLGYFTPDRMVPEFSEAALTLEPGEFSKEPVQTQFGFHVIKLEDRRDTVQPTLEEMEPQLRESVTATVVQDVLTELRENAVIDVKLPEATGGDADDGGANEAGAAEGSEGEAAQ